MERPFAALLEPPTWSKLRAHAEAVVAKGVQVQRGLVRAREVECTRVHEAILRPRAVW